MKHDKDYLDRLLNRGKYARLSPQRLSDEELQQVIRDARHAERVAPTIEVADEMVVIGEEAKDLLARRHPLQNAGQEGIVK